MATKYEPMTEDLARRIMQQVSKNIHPTNLNLKVWATSKRNYDRSADWQFEAETPACGTPACFFGHISFADPTPVAKFETIQHRAQRVLVALGITQFGDMSSLAAARPVGWPKYYRDLVTDFDDHEQAANVASIMARDIATGVFLTNAPDHKIAE